MTASALGAAVVTILVFAPRFWLWPAAGMPLRDLVSIQPELHRAFFALQQLDNPWQKIDSDVNRVIEWRLLWPVIAHYIGLTRTAYLAVPFLGCVLTLAAAAAIVWRATGDALMTASAAVLAATASWFFVSTGWLAYPDSWLILALLLASFARSRRILFLTAFLAPWSDERFILALPLCLGVRALDEDHRKTLRTDVMWLLAGIVPYVAIRIGAEVFQVRSTSTSYWAQRPAVPAPLGGMAIGMWHGLRLGWLVAIFTLVCAARERRWATIAAIVAGLIVNISIADDISRSSAVAVPLMVAGAVAFARQPTFRPRSLLPLLALGNLLLPAAHIIATPLSERERYHTTPIRSLFAEREQARHPPEFADPAVYTERGMQALGAGQNEIARNQFELALRFDPEFPRARAHRGILLFVGGKTQEGLAEIDRALARDPSLFDVRLQRATFRQRLGDLRGATDDAQAALRVMPANWPRRRDAERFAQALAAQAAAVR